MTKAPRPASADENAADAVRAKARALGFDDVGVTAARLAPEIAARLQGFLAAGRHGTMTWMEERAAARGAPQRLWPDARSAVVVAMNYGPDVDPMAKLDQKSIGNISVYAQNKDYHDILKKRLKQLGRWTAATYDCAIKVFVDTAPVMEKPLANAAGLGWQGKHTNLVSRRYGSWLFLGVMLTEIDLTGDGGAADAPVGDHCGACRRCLDVCPTNAFPAPYQLDARRCISYLTIEHKGPIERQFRKAIGNRIYGCDDCLAVCPWNKFAARAREQAFHPREALTAPLLSALAQLGDAQFRETFAGSPIKRIKRDRFVRNVLIAIGNSGERDLVRTAEALLDDPDPVVRGAAVWACAQLSGAAQLEALAAERRHREEDKDVLEEWRAALAGDE